MDLFNSLLSDRPHSRRAFLAWSLVTVGFVGMSEFAVSDPLSELTRFLKVSSDLCGFQLSELDPRRAELYLRELKRVEPELLNRLLTCPNLGEIQERELEELSFRIAEFWYSGLHNSDIGAQRVAYRDALAWRAIDFARPPSYCGSNWGRS